MEVEKFIERKNKLPGNLKKNYEVYGIINSKQWPKFMSEADMLISRSGANIVSEILSTKTPSILIPLQIAYLDEQKENALFAKKFGIARVIEQRKLSKANLLKEIYRLDKDWESVISRIKHKESPDIKAAGKLVDVLATFIPLREIPRT